MTGLLAEGVQIAILGMGVVFSLLGLLVLVMKGMSRLALALEGPRPPAPPASAPDDSELIAVVTAAALAAHRAAIEK